MLKERVVNQILKSRPLCWVNFEYLDHPSEMGNSRPYFRATYTHDESVQIVWYRYLYHLCPDLFHPELHEIQIACTREVGLTSEVSRLLDIEEAAMQGQDVHRP